MNFPKEHCNDCPKRETCPDRGNPEGHLIRDLADVILTKIAKKKAQEVLNKAEELLKKPTGKKMTIRWRN